MCLQRALTPQLAALELSLRPCQQSTMSTDILWSPVTNNGLETGVDCSTRRGKRDAAINFAVPANNQPVIDSHGLQYRDHYCHGLQYHGHYCHGLQYCGRYRHGLRYRGHHSSRCHGHQYRGHPQHGRPFALLPVPLLPRPLLPVSSVSARVVAIAILNNHPLVFSLQQSTSY
jgi:hypothetical protein